MIKNIKDYPYKGANFLVTGGAGFIGSNIAGFLLDAGALKVRVLDNLSTGKLKNIEDFLLDTRFEFIEGDIRDLIICKKSVEGIDFVCHQAAIGSVPRSVNDPITSNAVNIDGFLNMLLAAKDQKARGFVYASSSSVYGDSKFLPKVESQTGKPLSPYAVTKYVNELYAAVFSSVYGFHSIGLRYFNIFGPKQDPESVYAAVIPRFIQAALEQTPPIIHGDGLQARDFTFIQNAVQANVRAMFGCEGLNSERIYNVAVGEKKNLLEVWNMIADLAGIDIQPQHTDIRIGDVRESLADISLMMKDLNYRPEIRLNEGLHLAFDWYRSRFSGV